MVSQSPLDSLLPPPSRNVTIGDTSAAAVYTDIGEEYRALRRDVGLIDHRGCMRLIFTGDAAAGFVNHLVTRDVEFLFPERVVPALLLDDNADIIDVVTIQHAGEQFWMDTTVGSGSAVLAHVRDHLVPAAEVAIDAETWIVGVEGPNAGRVISRTLGADVAALPYAAVYRRNLRRCHHRSLSHGPDG